MHGQRNIKAFKQVNNKVHLLLCELRVCHNRLKAKS